MHYQSIAKLYFPTKRDHFCAEGSHRAKSQLVGACHLLIHSIENEPDMAWNYVSSPFLGIRALRDLMVDPDV